MFDARSLLDHIVRGGGQTNSGQSGGLGDILGQLGNAFGQQGQSSGGGQGGATAPSGGLGDILGQIGSALGQPAQGGGAQGGAASSGGGGFGDILGQLGKAFGQEGAPQSGQPMPRSQIAPGGPDAQAAGQGGGLMDILGQVLGQATQGVKESAGRIDNATGMSGQLGDMLSKATGKSPDELMAQLKELVQNNQLGAGALAGGLGAVLLGTRSGRSRAATAAKLGGLAMIGGLAYKAYQNYQQGKPLVASGQQGESQALLAAPSGSGFEADAVTNESAILLIRAMIAAAASDGRIDAEEQQKMLGSLQQAGMDAGAEEFLANELNNPASVDDLVSAVTSPAEAVQVFTAARVAIDLDTAEEHDFLVSLANGLGLDGDLVAHIDAAARSEA
ncbi:MAG: tellurite resistance TerB family protein [Hyphomicrobiaceae bacterium]